MPPEDIIDTPARLIGGEAGANAAGEMRIIEQSPITLVHLAIIGLCACGFAIDLVELALGGALSAVFTAKPYSLNPDNLAWLVSSTYVGAIVGAPLFGWAADRLGPKRILCILTVWIGICSILSGMASNADALAIIRLFAGFALGAFPPVMIAYLTDIAPSERRGAVIFWACGVAYLAPPLAIFTVRWLTPITPFGIAGWRWPFAVAGLVALLAGIAMTGLPEAPHWLAARGRYAALRLVSARIDRAGRAALPRLDIRRSPRRYETEMASGGRPRGRTASLPPKWPLIILSVISFTVPIATVTFPLLTGPILLARHFNLSDTLFYIGVATFGPVVGTLVGGAFIDRLDRRFFMAVCAGGMLGSVALFFLADAHGPMAASLVGFALFTALYMPTMTLYGAELFAPSTRARATSIAWVANRIAAACAPALLIPMVHQHATMEIALVLGVALVLNILVVAIFAPLEGADPAAAPRRSRETAPSLSEAVLLNG